MNAGGRDGRPVPRGRMRRWQTPVAGGGRKPVAGKRSGRGWSPAAAGLRSMDHGRGRQPEPEDGSRRRRSQVSTRQAKDDSLCHTGDLVT